LLEEGAIAMVNAALGAALLLATAAQDAGIKYESSLDEALKAAQKKRLAVLALFHQKG
jgi:hypothetical protein